MQSIRIEVKLAKYAYLLFGAGPGVCIGNSFAMMEARLILATVLPRFKSSLTAGQTVHYEQLLTLRPKGGLKMRVEKSAFPAAAVDKLEG